MIHISDLEVVKAVMSNLIMVYENNPNNVLSISCLDKGEGWHRE